MPLIDPTISEEINMEEIALLETGDFPSHPIKANLLGKKIIVFNNNHGSLLYGYGRYYGIPVGIRKPKSHIFVRPLELTMFEAHYLQKLNLISIFLETSQNSLSPDQFYAFACENFPDFEDKFSIYEDLRIKKYIPRPGQKFGADFIVYRQGPGVDHSSFVIQVLSQHQKISSIDVVRSARLATSVKKRFILANPLTKSYFSFKWFKP